MSAMTGNVIKSFIGKNMTMTFIAMFCALAGSLVQVMLPLSIGRYIEIVFGGNTAKGGFLHAVGIDLVDLHAFLIFFVLLILIRVILSFVEQYLLNTLEDRLAVFLRHELFVAQLSHHDESFRSKKVSHYMTRYAGELSPIRQLFSKGVIKSTSDVLVMFFALLALYSTSHLLTSVLILSLLVAALIMWGYSYLLRNASGKKRNEKLNLTVFIESRLSAWMTIKAFNKATPEINKFESRERKLHAASVEYNLLHAIQHAMLPFLYFTMTGVLLLVASYHAVDVSPSDILIFILLLLYMQSPLRRLMRLPAVVRIGRESLKGLLEIANLPAEDTDKTITVDAVHNLEFRGVYFKQSLRNQQTALNCVMKPGNLFWIRTGNGLSARDIIGAVLKLHDHFEGDILLNGLSIRDLKPFEVRKLITVSGKEFALLGKNVFEAISYKASSEKVHRATRVLTELELCSESDAPDYLEKRIDQKNILTNSESNRLMFARMLMSGKKVFMMEDPFSLVDASTRDILVRKLESIRRNHMIIIISEQDCTAIKPDYSITL